MNKEINFKHETAAHCENGVSRNLLNFYGHDFTEAMVFGIGSGIFFSYMPFYKLNGVPVVSFRPLPGMIFKRVAKRLGFKVKNARFRNREKSMEALDTLLAEGIPAGMVVGVYHLTYFPKAYRFHFNAHNIVAYGRKNDHYIISDPIMETPETLSRQELQRVRYAQGTYKPRGKMYYIAETSQNIDLKDAVIQAIKQTCKHMLTIPVPYFGIKGISTMARHARKWPQKIGSAKAKKYLGQIVRMQEEIGTGGAGFRFLYAAFLQEAAEMLGNNELFEISAMMTADGDKWREFAVHTGRVYKERIPEAGAFEAAADLLEEIARNETEIFKRLRKAVS